MRQEKRSHLSCDRRLMLWGYGLLLISLLLLEFRMHSHAFFPWDGWRGFSAAFGLVTVVSLALIARFLLRPLVMRDEEYYDR